MTFPLLVTKFSIPTPARSRVERPRLLAKLNECLNPGCRLALISAPAGYGKTTLVGAWACELQGRAAWLSLDDGDNDPVTFWTYFIAALQTRMEGIGKEVVSMLQSPQPVGPDAFLPLLLNDLAQVDGPFVLVLDDFHLVRNVAIHRWMAFLLEHAPARFRILIASRADPPLPLALMRGRGQLLEIRSAELRFSNEEAETYLNETMKLGLSPAALERLNVKTEGWAAGLQMAALAIHGAPSSSGAPAPGRKDAGQFIETFSSSNRYIMEYLLEEVLTCQPEGVQTFLLYTAVLENLCGPLCDAVLDSPGESQSRLEYLEDSNLFIVPLDGERRWYRYHPLFADLVRKRLLERVDRETVRTLHNRASLWCEENGLFHQSIEHAFLAGNEARAACLLERLAETLWWQGAHTHLLDWLGRLSGEQMEGHPSLSMYKAAVLAVNGNLLQAEACLDGVEGFSDAGRVCAVRTLLAASRGGGADLIRYAGLALEKLNEEEDTAWRAYLWDLMSTGNMARRDYQAAYRNLMDAIEIGKSGGHLFVVLDALPKLMMLLWLKGQLRQAGKHCLDGIAFVEQNNLGYTQAARMIFLSWAFVLCERNELDQAGAFLKRAADPRYLDSNKTARAWIYHVKIPYLVARGEVAAAEEAAIEAVQLSRKGGVPLWLACIFTGALAKIWVRLGKLAEAGELLDAHGVGAGGAFEHPHEGEFTALATLLWARGELEAARELFLRLLEWAGADQNTGWLISLQSHLSLLYRAQGDMGRALETLGQALELAEPEGYFQTFLLEGEDMAGLLGEAVRRGIHREYAGRLLAAFPGENHPQPGGTNPRGQVPLNERERAVIRLVAGGLANKEIARKLHVSLRTVKYYTANIYSKLGVNGRAHAAVRARELGLLDGTDD